MFLPYILCIIVFIITLCKLTCAWCHSKVCLVGKTAIITGGNSGIGYQAALSLASRGCRVIIADIDDASLSRERIIKETHNPNIVTKILDLRSFKSVRAFAEDIIESESKVHILINNAGVGTLSATYTEDGLHNTMQVNYFGHFLLTHLLIDVLKKSTPSRIIFTSSIAAFLTKLKLEDLNPPKTSGSSPRVYANSKLCEVLAANGFAEKLRGTGVTSNSFHPGGVRSKLFFKALKEETYLLTLMAGLLAFLFGKNTEEGAQTLIYLACAEEVEKVTGSFFMECGKFIQPLQARDKKLCEKIWNASMKLIKLDSNEEVLEK